MLFQIPLVGFLPDWVTFLLAVVALSSTDPTHDTVYLSNYAILRIIDNLKRLPGVGNAMVFGAQNYSMRLILDPIRMAQLNLTPTDIAKLLVQLAHTWQGFSSIFLHRGTLQEMLTPQNGGPYGLGAAIAGDGAALVLMKRGQNIGYQGYLILYPATGQGMVVMTNSDNGSKLSEALIKRAASAYDWPDLPPLAD